MAKITKTARGRTLDMAGLVARQERTRAVSNIKSVNARGDEIDATGKVVKPVNEVVAESYANHVGNKSAQSTRSSANPNAPLSPKQKRELEAQQQKAKETPLLDKIAEAPKQKQTFENEQKPAQTQNQTSVLEQDIAQSVVVGNLQEETLADDFIEDDDEAIDIEAIKKACLDAQTQKDTEVKKKGK
jgi:hypothetical protein